MSKTRFSSLVLDFLAFLQHSRGRSARTVEVYQLALTRLAEYMGDADPLEATHEDLVIFSGRWLFEKNVGASARRPYVAAIRGFFKWCAARGHVRKNPAGSMEYAKVGSKIPRRMTLANAEKLLYGPDLSTFLGLRDSAMLHILIGCGVRVSGLTNINEGDFLADRVNDEPRLFVKVREKGSQEQIKLLPMEADLVVRMYLESPDLAKIDRTIIDGPQKGDKVAFVSLANHKLPPDQYVGEARRLKRAGVFDRIQHYGRKAGIPADQLHPHALRHLFGTELLESDVNLARAQQLMGHKDPKSTLIYVSLATGKNAAELDRANPLAKIKTPISQFLDRLKNTTRK